MTMSICLDCGYTDDFCHCEEPKPAPPEVPAFKTIAVKAHRNRIAIAGGKFRCADCFAVIGEECPGCDAPAGYCEENCAMRDRSEVPAPDEPVCPSTSVHGPHKNV